MFLFDVFGGSQVSHYRQQPPFKEALQQSQTYDPKCLKSALKVPSKCQYRASLSVHDSKIAVAIQRSPTIEPNIRSKVPKKCFKSANVGLL